MLIDPNRGGVITVSTSEARKRIAYLVDWVHRPDGQVVLTRNGRRVAAMVSIYDLERIMAEKEVQTNVDHLKHARIRRLDGRWSMAWSQKPTTQECAEEIRRAQLSRAQERAVLEKAGLEPVPGGEVVVEVEEKVQRKRRWWQR
ncbi:MAG: type II toxin-antitoxin system Phd/YefM family antitoxin [Pseudomonadota bacterium]